MRGIGSVAAVLLAAGIVACAGGGESPVGSGAFASATIGAEGGRIDLDGASLVVPAGALDAPASIRLTQTDEDPPGEFTTVTPVYALSPAGLALKAPATLTIPLVDEAADPVLVLATADETGWTVVGGSASDGAVAAAIPRLGRAFVVDRADLPPGVGP
jgi:hypothetical protein